MNKEMNDGTDHYIHPLRNTDDVLGYPNYPTYTAAHLHSCPVNQIFYIQHTPHKLWSHALLLVGARHTPRHPGIRDCLEQLSEVLPCVWGGGGGRLGMCECECM